jgi:hypothetical protein
MKPLFICFILALIITVAVHAQKKTVDGIEGVWKGTSLCQVKHSSCNDENVVYYISKSKTENTYTVQASKIVNGTEVEMGPLDLIYDNKKHTLTSQTSKNGGVWFFKLDGEKIHGTLTLNENTLYRVVELTKNSGSNSNGVIISDSKVNITARH